jgi:hypothetical protein
MIFREVDGRLYNVTDVLPEQEDRFIEKIVRTKYLRQHMIQVLNQHLRYGFPISSFLLVCLMLFSIRCLISLMK